MSFSPAVSLLFVVPVVAVAVSVADAIVEVEVEVGVVVVVDDEGGRLQLARKSK